jgi:hypothetical protein
VVPGGGSTIRGKGEGGACARHYVLLTDPCMKYIMAKLYVHLLSHIEHGEDELMEQKGAVLEEGKVPLLHTVCRHHCRKLSMCMCSMGLQHTRWIWRVGWQSMLRGHSVITIAIAVIGIWFSLYTDKKPLPVQVFIIHDFNQVMQV